MNKRARGTAALLAATGLVTGLLTGSPAALAAGVPGTITTVAGGPGAGSATKVYQEPVGLAVGSAGALYVADYFNSAVKEFSDTSTDETVVAGTGRHGYSGDGGPATRAELSGVGGLAVDSSGNVLITDTFNSRIRVVAHSTGTFYDRP